MVQGLNCAMFAIKVKAYELERRVSVMFDLGVDE